MPLILMLFLFSLNAYSAGNNIGFITKDKTELFNDYKLSKVVRFANAKKEVIIVNSYLNSSVAQKINLNGFNYWIHLKNILIVDYPEFFEGGGIDQNRGRIIKDYIERLYSN